MTGAMKRKKTYNNITGQEMMEVVEDIEEAMSKIDNDIFANPYMIDCFDKLKKLDTSERRLFIVYSELNCSVVKTAKYFNVDRRTVSNRIKEIKDKMFDYADTDNTQRPMADNHPDSGTAVQDTERNHNDNGGDSDGDSSVAEPAGSGRNRGNGCTGTTPIPRTGRSKGIPSSGRRTNK